MKMLTLVDCLLSYSNSLRVSFRHLMNHLYLGLLINIICLLVIVFEFFLLNNDLNRTSYLENIFAVPLLSSS